MLNSTESQIRERIAAFVQELDQLVRRSALEAIQGVLANGSAPMRRGRPAGKRGRPAGGRGRSSANVDEAAAKIAAHVRAHDGQGISAISAATGVPLPLAKKAAGKLLASGELSKSGERRGTVYHAGGGKPARSGARGKKRGRKSKKAA
jgi:hypothetical protein